MNNLYKIKTQDVPDDYKMDITFINGQRLEADAVAHSVIRESGLVSIQTKDNLITWVPVGNILKIQYDKNFTKLLEAKSKKEQEAVNGSPEIHDEGAPEE